MSVNGYTLVELLVGVAIIGVFVVFGFVGYIAFHFILKFW